MKKMDKTNVEPMPQSEPAAQSAEVPQTEQQAPTPVNTVEAGKPAAQKGWMDPVLVELTRPGKDGLRATDRKTLFDVFGSQALDVLKALSIKLKKDLTLEEGLTVVGNDITAPGEGDVKTGKLVECWLCKHKHGAKADYVPHMFVPRYIARTKDRQLMDDRKTGKPVLVGNFVTVLNKGTGQWEILAGAGNPFEERSCAYQIRAIGLEMESVKKPLPALTYEEAQAFIARSTAKHQANLAQSQERKQLAGEFAGKRERGENKEPFNTMRFQRNGRRK